MLCRAQVGLRMYCAAKRPSARSAEKVLIYSHTLGAQEAFSRLIMHGISLVPRPISHGDQHCTTASYSKT